jgi:hypothetical protein
VVTDGWRAAWIDALDALELDVRAAEALLTDAHRESDTPTRDPWHPPTALGPLPIDLRPRVDAILARQIAAAGEISRRLVANRQQNAMVDRMETGEAMLRPAYLDCAI